MKPMLLLVAAVVLLVGLGLFFVDVFPRDDEPERSREDRDPLEFEEPGESEKRLLRASELRGTLEDAEEELEDVSHPRSGETSGVEGVEISHGDGDPASRAGVALIQGRRVLFAGFADPEGRWFFPEKLEADSEGAMLAIFGVVYPVHLEPLVFESRLQRVILPEGESLSGRVVADGAPPRQAILLALTPERGFYSEGGLRREMSARIAAAFLEEGVADPFSIRSGKGGEFRVSGLQAGFKGKFGSPDGYRFRGRDLYSLPVEAPNLSLLVELESLPMLRGRVLGENREAIGGVFVSYELAMRDGQLASRVHTDGSGRFEIPLPNDLIESARLVFFGGEGMGKKVVEVSEVDARVGEDLGDILLFRGRDVCFLVVDEKGDPVPEARAFYLDETGRVSEPTDTGGRGCVRGILETKGSFRVAGFCRPSVEVTVPDSIEGEVRVVLPHGSGFDVRILDRIGNPARGFTLEVRARETPFVESRGFGPDQFQLWFGSSEGGSSEWRKGVGGRIRFLPTPDARIVLACLKPGVLLTCQPIAPGGFPHGEEVSIVAQKGDYLFKEIRLEVTSRELRGRVSDLEGRPLSWVGVAIGRELGLGSRSSDLRVGTDKNGEFVFSDLYQDSVNLLFQKEGFAPIYLEKLEVLAAGREIDVTMVPGVEAVVRVLDRRERPVNVERVWAESREGRELGFGSQVEPGVYRFADLPDELVVFSLRVAGRVTSVTARPSFDGRILLPEHGALDVVLPGDLGGESRIVVSPDDGRGGVFYVGLEVGEGRLGVPVVFPGMYTVQIETLGESWFVPFGEPRSISVEEGSEVELDFSEE